MPPVALTIWIHAGRSWSPWRPRADDLNRGDTPGVSIGGSQVAAACMARALASLGHHVTLFGWFAPPTTTIRNADVAADDAAPPRDGSPPPEVVVAEPEGLGTVRYVHAERYDACFSAPLQCDVCNDERKVDLLVVSRYVEFIPTRVQRTNVRVSRVWFWCHDVYPIGEARDMGSQRPLDAVLCLSQWHETHLRQTRSIPAQIPLLTTSNGLRPEAFVGSPWEGGKKVPGRFLYSSAAYRGLDTLLQCWPAVRKACPHATLHIHTDLDSPLMRRSMTALSDALRQQVEALRADGVTLVGFSGQNALAQAWYGADVWMYPTEFDETYCITALEAQAGGALCVATPVAALTTTVGARGRVLPVAPGTGPDERAAWHASIVEAAVDACTSPADKGVPAAWTDREKRHQAREWALRQTWTAVAEQWLRWRLRPA